MTLLKTYIPFVVLPLFILSCQTRKGDVTKANSDSLLVLQNLLDSLSKPTYTISQKDSSIPTIVSLKEIENRIDKLDGQYIETEGIFNYGFENCSIHSSQSFDNHTTVFWLELFNGKLNFNQPLKNFLGKRIKIRGTIDKANQGHLNAYKAAITNITYFKVLN